jgi:hypothetical protein
LTVADAKTRLRTAIQSAQQEADFNDWVNLFSGRDAEIMSGLAISSEALAQKQRQMDEAIKDKLDTQLEADTFRIGMGPSAREVTLDELLKNANVDRMTFEQDDATVNVANSPVPMTMSASGGQVSAQLADEARQQLALSADLVRKTVAFYDQLTAALNDGTITKENLEMEALRLWRPVSNASEAMIEAGR